MAEKAYKLIVIGGSSGSVSALVKLIPEIKPAFNIPIILVLHRQPASKQGFISEILQNKTHLCIKEADEKENIRSGTIYVAPADYHLLIEKDFTISLDASEKVLFSRPSINVTFESAASHLGEGLIGILLTGANNDGAAGIVEIAKQGGLTIAQDPKTAEVSTMPLAAINSGKIQHILTLNEIVVFLNNL